MSRWLRPSKCSDHLLVIEHMICNNICLSFRNSDKLFDVKPSINSVLLINVRGTRVSRKGMGKRKYSIVRTYYSYIGIYRFL